MSTSRGTSDLEFESEQCGLDSEVRPPIASGFRQIGELVALCDRAGAMRDLDASAKVLAADISRCIRRNLHAVPMRLRVPSEDGPRHIDLYRDPAWRFQIMLVVLGPRQSLPMHGHSGAWGVEAVWCGGLLVADFAICARSGGAVNLRPLDATHLIAGQSTTLMPRQNAHLCRNTSTREPAVFLHIHGAVVDDVTVYHPLGDDWYQPVQAPLAVRKLSEMDLADRHVDTYS